jgi:hypothetical protein
MDKLLRAWERDAILRLGAFVLLMLGWVALARVAHAADGAGARDVQDGLALKAARPPDLDAARAAFERAAVSDDPTAAAEGLYLLAEMDDESFLFASALARYKASFARSPSSPYTPRAVSRASWLREHSEGDFAPLVRLETVRRDSALANNPAAIDALAKDADGFPPGRVQVEARMLVAEAYIGRMHRSDEGLAELKRVASDRHADVLTARQAAREIVDAYVAEGDLDAAARAARELGNKLDPKVGRDLARLARRRTLHRVAIFNVVAVLLCAALSLALGKGSWGALARELRRFGPFALAFVVYVGLIGGWLASSYESGNALPFILLGGATLLLGAAARAWAVTGSPRRWARGLRAALCASSVVAAGFLLLERIDASYLAGFGL